MFIDVYGVGKAIAFEVENSGQFVAHNRPHMLEYDIIEQFADWPYGNIPYANGDTLNLSYDLTRSIHDYLDPRCCFYSRDGAIGMLFIDVGKSWHPEIDFSGLMV